MPAVGGGDHELDSGHYAVLGHRLLSSAAVVTGALATLRDGNGSISPAQRALLEEAVGRNLASITEMARALMHGEVASEHERFSAAGSGVSGARSGNANERGRP